MTDSLLVGRDGVLVCDGAMGTVLHAAGHPLDQQLPHLNVSHPDIVRAVHDSYLHSGADIVQTNTFGAIRLRLQDSGLDGITEQINRDGVRIAREAADAVDRPVLVAGSVSPALSVHHRGRIVPADRIETLREQMAVLVDAGVDLLVLETFGHLDELVEAVDVASAFDVPVIAQATFAEDEHMLSGHTAADLARAVPEERVVALGTNCTLGPQGCLAVVRELARHTSVPLSAQPNAGLPRRVGPSRFEYDIDSDYLVRYVRQLIDAGAAILGGCCGTTPAQIGAVAGIVREHERSHPRSRPRERLVHHDDARPRPFLVGAEIAPPPADMTEHVVRTARRLTDTGLDTVVVAAAPAGHARVSPVTLAVDLGDRTGVDPIICVPPRGRTITALQAELLGAHALGVRRVVCEAGTSPSTGDYPGVGDLWEVDSTSLITLLRGLNEGRDHIGAYVATPTSFEIGARVNLGHDDIDATVGQAKHDIDSGAGFLLTHPIFELDALDHLLREIDSSRTPVIATLRPVTTVDEAEYLRHEVPDARVPEHVVTTLAESGTSSRDAGLGIALDLATEVATRAQGLIVCGAEASDVAFVEQLIATCRMPDDR